MTNTHRVLRTVLVVCATLLLMFSAASCTVQQEIVVHADSSGKVNFDIALEDFFLLVLDDFAVFLPPEEADITQESLDNLQNELNKSTYAKNARIQKLDDNYLTGTFDFIDFEGFFKETQKDISKQSIFSYAEANNLHTITIHLDIDNYDQLTKLIPLLKDPSFSIFGPEENIGVSEADYMEMISYVLGEEGPGAIDRSYISLRIKTDKPIVSHSGGKKLTADSIVFNVPLIDFLLLAKPIDYSVTW